MDSDQERKKWDYYYANLHQDAEAENVQKFRDEFVGIVDGLLHDGGRILEAGCGAGEQSLALAQRGKFEMTLMDFSTEAIDTARKSFAQAGVEANFSIQDVFMPGEPEFDLVFNAGVLEHYASDEQVELLRGMASRSRKYVLVMVPNFSNYWYWIWRIQKSSQGLWPFGKEIPAVALGSVFEAAGMQYQGSAYIGSGWTESFVTGINGLSEDLQRVLLEVHRSGLLPETQTNYLLAGLGSVGEQPASKFWLGISQEESQSTSQNLELVSSALADALAIKIGDERDAQQLRQEFNAQLSTLSAQLERLQQAHVADLVERVREIEAQSAKTLAEQIHQIELDHEQRLTSQLQAIEQQNASKLTKRIRELEQQNADQFADTVRLLEKEAAAILAYLKELQVQQNEELVEQLSAYERQRDIDQMGMIRQIEHDHTGVLVGKIQEIEFLRRQIEALRLPRTLNVGSLLRFVLYRGYTKFKRILKGLRHFFQKEAPQVLGTEEIAFQPPLSLGHPHISAERRVVILSYTFFDFDGNNMYYGGAERYMLELARLFRAFGYYPELYQCGNGYWVRYYQGLRVTGIDVGGEATRLADEVQKFDQAQALTIYSPFSLAQFTSEAPGVGISHGVFWDYAEMQANPTAMQAVFDAGRYLDRIVSVDTNTINTLRAAAASAALVDKFDYIPNFVDTKAFDVGPTGVDEKIVVLYPRRLYRPRGFWLVADVVEEILNAYPQVEFHFVGKADPREEEHILSLSEHYLGRIHWYWLPPEEMPQAYQQAHITIIPTVHSEGTSLSCLEAMASGNAVIATNVGGLPNLILPDFNGLLIDVSAEALLWALKKLIEDKALRQKFGRRGRDVAQSFSIVSWRSRWEQVLRRYLPVDDKGEILERPVALFTAAPGIPWEGIKQRPHHLAVQLAKAGIETFWQDPDKRSASPEPLLHILGPEDEINLQRPVVFIYYPFHYQLLDQFDDPLVVYDVLDDISIHAASDKDLPKGQRAVDFHHQLMNEADLVMTSSDMLHRQIKPVRSDVILVPNGIDLTHFQKSEKHPQTLSAPVIGFHGAIADWIDVDLLVEVAKLRPDYHFQLVGPVSIEIERLIQLPNIQYLKAVNYEEIPRTISHFDVGVLPFKLNQLTHAVRPLKVLEYLAMGMPVVAVPLDEIKDWPGVLLADSPDDFAQQLDRALDQKGVFSTDKDVREFIAAADWSNTVSALLERLQEFVKFP